MTDRDRCREAAQILIDQIGAAGPENVEETAARAVKVIQGMLAGRDDLRVQIGLLLVEVDRLKARLNEIKAEGPDWLTPTERRLVTAALDKAEHYKNVAERAFSQGGESMREQAIQFFDGRAVIEMTVQDAIRSLPRVKGPR